MNFGHDVLGEDPRTVEARERWRRNVKNYWEKHPDEKARFMKELGDICRDMRKAFENLHKKRQTSSEEEPCE